jgi:hypothetical protein
MRWMRASRSGVTTSSAASTSSTNSSLPNSLRARW